MSQAVEVRFINPATAEKLADNFVQLASKQTHKDAVELALKVWSGGVGVLKEFVLAEDSEWILHGANYCWRTIYTCVLEDDEADREMIAVLFSEYKRE